MSIDLEKLRSIGVLKRTDPPDWERDRAAYKRLRDAGLQPNHVAGSARLEATSTSRFEVEMGHLAGSEAERRALKDALDRGRELELEGM